MYFYHVVPTPFVLPVLKLERLSLRKCDLMSFWLRMEGHPWPFSEGKQSTAAWRWGHRRASGRRRADWRRLVQTAGHRTRRSPGSELSRTGCPWSRGNSGSAGGGGTCRRSGTVAWRCRTPELQETQGEKGREDGGAINGSHGDTPAEDITRRVHRAQAVSTLSLKQSRCIREGKTEASAARMPIVRPSRRRRAKKTARFYGFMDIFSGNKGSRKILAKQKSKPTAAAMRWNEWVGNERLPAHCETRLLCRTTISSCYSVSQKHSQEEETTRVRCLVPPLLDLPLKCK